MLDGPLQFVDETGDNPLPPGVFVIITSPDGPPPGLNGTAIAVGWTVRGGYVYLNGDPVTLTTGNYIATFYGMQAPPRAQAFSYVSGNVILRWNEGNWNETIWAGNQDS